MIKRFSKRACCNIVRSASGLSSLENLEPRRLFSVPPMAGFLQYVSGTGDKRSFAILYDGPASIDRASLGGDDVVVTSSSGIAMAASFYGATHYKPGTGTVARYRVTGIAGGSYSIAVREGKVLDDLGAAVQGGTVGGFLVGRRGHTIPVGTQQVLTPSVRVASVVAGGLGNTPEVDTTFGTVVKAINFGGPSYNTISSTGDPISYQSQLTQGLGAQTNLPGPFSNISVDLASQIPNDLFDQSVGDRIVFNTETFTMSRSDEYLKVSGLDPTRTYSLQFLHGDDQGGDFPYVSTPQEFTLPTGQSTTANLAFGSISNADAIITVIVAGTDVLTYRMPQCPTRGPSFSGVVIEVSSTIAPVQPDPFASATFVRSSVRLTGSSHTFQVAYNDPRGITATRLEQQALFVTGPNGFAARAKVIALDTGPTADSAVATYQVDGIAFTSRYTLSVFDAPIAQVTLFYLRPQQWE